MQVIMALQTKFPLEKPRLQLCVPLLFTCISSMVAAATSSVSGKPRASSTLNAAGAVLWAAKITDASCTWKHSALLHDQRLETAQILDSTVAGPPVPVHVRAPNLGLDTNDARLVAANLKNSSNPLLLCSLEQTRHGAIGALEREGASSSTAQVALFVLADSPAYLTNNEPVSRHTKMSVWTAHKTKLAFVRANGNPFFLMFGKLYESNLHRDPITATKCAGKGPPGGLINMWHVKAIGLIALFEHHPHLMGAVYIDCDAAIMDVKMKPEAFFALAPNADLMGSSNFKEPVFMNGGVLLLRNTNWAKRMLATWWWFRCGYNDQVSLWQSLFLLWGVSIEPEIWAESATAAEPITSALRYLSVIKPMLQNRAHVRQTHWRCDGACSWLLQSTGCLSEPLELPRVLLLPLKPFLDVTRNELPALQHYSGLMYHHNQIDQWVCHGDNLSLRGCAPKNPASNERDFCAWCWAGVQQVHRGCHQRRKRCSVSKHATVCDLQNQSNYLCSCAEVLLPRFTLLPESGSLRVQCESCTNASWVFDANNPSSSLLHKPSYISEVPLRKGMKKLYSNRSSGWLAQQRNGSLKRQQNMLEIKKRRRAIMDSKKLRSKLSNDTNASAINMKEFLQRIQRREAVEQMTPEQIKARKKKKKKAKRKKEEKLQADIAAGKCKSKLDCKNKSK